MKSFFKHRAFQGIGFGLLLAVLCALGTWQQPQAVGAEPAFVTQTTPPKTPPLGTGSIFDTLKTTLKDPLEPELVHEILTARLPQEDDFEFFRRHANRVATYKKFLKGTK